MNVEVAKPDEIGPPERRLWASWQEADERLANPFLSATFTRLVGAARPTARMEGFEKRCNWMLAYDPAYSVYRPGILLTVSCIEDADRGRVRGVRRLPYARSHP